MKKSILINSEISAIIAQLGHMDTIVIGDMGLPIPDGVYRIDLALKKGMPRFQDVLENILTEMQVESCIIATEATEAFEQLCNKEFQKSQNVCPIITKLPHKEFKQLTKQAKAMIRTGEDSAYYNIILSAGITF